MLKQKKKFFYNNNIIELKNRIFFLIFSIVIFRIGSFIPIPGIDNTVLENAFYDQKGTAVDIFNMFSGGALSRASIFSLGIMPYISSSIIMQLLILLNSRLSDIQKDGELGKYKIAQYTRYLTCFLCILQSIGISSTLPNIPGMQGLVMNPNLCFYIIASMSLLTGTMILMWLGELITEFGIGNGVSVIIFIGIISSLPMVIENTINKIYSGELSLLLLLVIPLVIFFVIFLVVIMERSHRKIILNYVHQHKVQKMYSVQNTYLPLKINMSGVIPAIFASSVIVFPMTILLWIGTSYKCFVLIKLLSYLQPGNVLYMIIYSFLIVFFCFFYSHLSFNARETSEYLKKSGAFILGVRPGEQTSKYISNIVLKLTFIGSLYMLCICLLPDCMRFFMHVPFYFGGTTLLIVTVVIMDFITQVQTLIMSKQYNSILKKSNLNVSNLKF
ncbi:preprotein translocase subunit SecY [Buchnera aphidicola]|uniref:Protein translocase subunit SecY n=1 Tax=Buchnera aphidicola (Stegophylla sp.) TaxID=2315800 RepID=A0A4D6YLE8_9GAMM|nr:preprotein translocase subunit SecY [Buchnera aphidicola (Stegophylla sp.)]QCI26468.1 preprotein translocase subunit SecY [Buchnera aphidicola (Stegophylla sp.)]